MTKLSNELIKLFQIRSAGDGEKTPEEIAAQKVIDDKVIADKVIADAEAERLKKIEDEKNKEKDIKSFSEDAQKVIKDLRAENAKHRTTNNNLSTRMENIEGGFKKMFGDDDDKRTPEQKLDAVQSENESLAIRNSILELASENGISGDGVEYFEFLMSKGLNSLDEGQEMSDEALAEIVSKCSKGGKANTGFGKDGKPLGKTPDNKDGEVTQAEFDKMGMTARTKLFQTNRPLYDKLMNN